MLETIFGTLNDSLTALASMFLKAVSALLKLDLAYLVERFPILGSAYALFQGIGLGLIILLAGFALLKFYIQPTNENQVPPHMVLVRALGAVLMVYMGGYLFEEAVNLASNIYNAFLALGDGVTDVFTGADQGLGVTIATATANICGDVTLWVLSGGYTAIMELILSLVLLFVLFKSFLRLISEVLERYVLVGVLTFIAPLPCATLASPSVSQVFSRYLNMYFGQLLLMSLSVFSYNLALSALTSIQASMSAVDTLIQVLLVVACCKIGERMDTFMQQLGIGVGVTGGGMGEELIGVAMSAGHMFKNAFAGWNSAGSGGADGTGHRSDNVLGGQTDSSGGVQPEPYGTGLFGAGVSAVRYGAAAVRNGGNAQDVMAAAKKGAKAGFGFSESDVSVVTGRTINQHIQNAANARRAATSPVTRETAGGAMLSGDRKTPVLDPTAENLGIKIGKGGPTKDALEGNNQQVGRFMAANMGTQSGQPLIRNTARSGNPAASEQALFGTHNNLVHNDASQVTAREYDQAGSDMMMATMGDGLADIEQRADKEALAPEEENLRDVGAAMASSMNGDDSNGYLSKFDAHDTAQGGREITADVMDKSGQQVGTVTALDEKGYKGLSAEQKAGFVPVKSATGATYYMRASGVEVNQDGSVTTSNYGKVTPMAAPGTQTQPQAQPQTATAGGQPGPGTGNGNVTVTNMAVSNTLPEGSPFVRRAEGEGLSISDNWAGTGVTITSDGQKDIITGTDSAYVGAAINQAVVSERTDEQRLVADTLNSPALDKDAVREGLLNPDAGGIAPGYDASVAKMVDVGLDARAVGQAAGSIKSTDGTPVMSPEAAKNMAPAIQAASGAPVEVQKGYSADNFSVEGGKTIYDYHTPDGDYRVEMSEYDPSTAEPPAKFEAGGSTVGMSVQPIIDPGVAQESLFNNTNETPQIQGDQQMAQMLDAGIGAGVAEGAVGRLQTESGDPVIPQEDVSHLGPAIRAASGTGMAEVGYSCEDFSAKDGVVGFNYNTPGGAYRVEMSEFSEGSPAMQQESPVSQFTAGERVYNVTATPINVVRPEHYDHPEQVIPQIDPAADLDPSNDDGHHGGKGKKKRKK